MEKTYWALFWLSLICLICAIVLAILCFAFVKKVFLKKKNGALLFILSLMALSLFGGLSGASFMCCYKDYHYVSNHTYEEEQARFIEYTCIEKDSDGTGKTYYSKPRFYLVNILLYALKVKS